MRAARRQPAAAAPPRALALVREADSFVTAKHPCGCDGGLVSAPDNSRATWYGEGPDILVPCRDCGGYGYHELRGILNGPQFDADHPRYAGRGGAFVARLTDDGERGAVLLGWATSLEAARVWDVQQDWTPGVEDAGLLAALRLAPWGSR